MRLRLKYPAYFLLLLMIASCHRHPLNINVSNVNISLSIKRLDQDLFTVTPANVKEMVPLLEKKFNPFFDLYNKEVLAIGNSRDSLYNGYLLTFLKDSTYASARLKSDSVFNNFRPYATQLEMAFKHYHYYYPELPVPTVYTYISGFNQSIVTTPAVLGISLDNYFGQTSRFYRQLGIYEYKRRNMEPAKMVFDAMYGWANQQFEYKGNTEDLISGMIYQGKLLYFLDAMIPDGEDSLKIGYSKEQLDWCKANESQMWSYLVERKVLFSGERMAMVRFINPAPFTAPFGQKSPGRTGAWLGWQVVKHYMDKNRGVRLQELMAENDYHKILNESGYSPD
jgi:gliding motility-associated lipoprotein GldB